MSGEFDVAGAIAEGGMWARVAEPDAGEHTAEGHGKCLNCRTVLTGPHCHQCGQAAQVHRSISAFWHDILHGVLHFDGKFWNTLPLLVWKPGELTRRYVHGERVKFISPMALFLFSIFMMFAIFSYVGKPDFTGSKSVGAGENGIDVSSVGDLRDGVNLELQKKQAEITSRQSKLALLDPASETYSKEAADLNQLKTEVNTVAVAMGNEAVYPERVDVDGGNKVVALDLDDKIDTGWSALDALANKLVHKAQANPDLLLYKLQSNGYKFAWLLIPLSIPFVWLVTLGKRGHRFYDHAVFTTYSIAFMSLLFIVVTLSVKFDAVPNAVVPLALVFAPFHMYRQLRHAYGLSRLGAVVRLSVLVVSINFVVLLFLLALVSLGLIG